MREVTCTQCGWVHMGITVPKGKLKDPDSFPSTCFRCGWGTFRDTKEGDAPGGCTMQAVYLKL